MGVVDKVKFMLIDSRVFAEEVEPTGLVPMELSLEKFVQIEIYTNCIIWTLFMLSVLQIP